MTSTAARSARALVGLAFVAAGLVAGAGPTSGQTPPPEPVVVSFAFWNALTPSGTGECDGSVTPTGTNGGFMVERTGPLLDDLVVPLTFTGEKVADLVEVPASATLPAGEESVHVSISASDPSPGTLSVALGDGPDHDLGTPATADLSVGPLTVYPSCLSPWPVTPGTEEQTIAVGEVPEPYGFADLVGPGDPHAGATSRVAGWDLPSPGSMTGRAIGTLPPGLTYLDDEWGGAATTPGTYPFRVAVCFAGPDGDCIGSAAVTVTVRAPDAAPRPGPGPAAPPAVAVTGVARLTG